MSTFWSAWIIIGTLIVILGSAYLLRMVIVDTMGKEGEEMPHSFDGIVEINNPLPKWWTIMFAISIVWGLGYLAIYGLANFGGVLDWKSANKEVYSLEESRAAIKKSIEDGDIVQYNAEMQIADEVYGKTYANYAAKPVAELLEDPEALKVGQRLFIQNCAQCHGSDARGQHGFPNLSDKDWLYGGSFDKIKESIMIGRTAVGMMPWKDALGGDQGVEEVVAYVRSLSGRKVNAKQAAAGQAKFGLCMACHGADGSGNQMMGAPNLTDNIWLYGGSTAAITDSVANGRAGVMPAWQDILGNDKVHVISAYVYSLSNK
ncbi:cytochrome-c oxidase, cbb3-type subunit III [Psychrobium sp. 1_MG-2023]|uniref:cytochrome-c oxidase, cbb3-type subunit III n=1 Tax=Psychrobium sp. 1_MG-2023 TaxID=3062624 RepID=UPI000C331FE0|nr:cytochrome-c oxidase, cbb3-type subunit III [Psychrobium sp. 1_MG-2023]MDP2561548.1 cytochrome-c oxidase, cbb3-type subunit III [Psychrobium sp. 1_MG-2023]PKF55011.1 cytochrome-c oxidase, cbb3-type subunit III [Alteromonadales bacterium alter-6D02]